MKHYLLINNRPNIPVSEKWQLFDDRDKCLEAARKVGWGGSGFSLPLNETIGIVNVERGGFQDLDLIIVPMEVQP